MLNFVRVFQTRYPANRRVGVLLKITVCFHVSKFESHLDPLYDEIVVERLIHHADCILSLVQRTGR